MDFLTPLIAAYAAKATISDLIVLGLGWLLWQERKSNAKYMELRMEADRKIAELLGELKSEMQKFN